MNPQPAPWERLTVAARRASDECDTAAPYGFATRVAARAFGVPQPTAHALLEKLALRALMVAGVLGLAAAGYGYTALTAEPEYEVLSADAVAEMLAQS